MSEHEAVHRRRRREPGGVRQLPWRRLVNPYRPVEILSEEQVKTIHRASLRILSEIGMQVLGDRALDAFAGAGAMVDRGARTCAWNRVWSRRSWLRRPGSSVCMLGTRSVTSWSARRILCSAPWVDPRS